MKCSGRRAQKSRHADERPSIFREHPRNNCQRSRLMADATAGRFPIRRASAPPQPPYRYRGSHSVIPGHIYMMIMQMITMNM